MKTMLDSLVTPLSKVVAGIDLTEPEAEACFGHIMSGNAEPVRVGALLASMQAKGPSPTEIAGGVRALRASMVAVAAPPDVVDTCGTGGGRVTTFNISTAAALVSAAAGVRVAKHGNRSFTSKSGSADVLEALGVPLELSPEGAARVLSAAGIVFMFAPRFHPAMKHVGPVRRTLGTPTPMNLLGPLTNPARARRQVVGVADAELLSLIAEALLALGHDAAMVVHGEPGMDEISPCGPTSVVELKDGALSSYEVTPDSLGVQSVDPATLAGGDPTENAERIKAVLEGERSPARTAVVVNAAAAVYLADRAISLADGVRVAEHAIDSGGARAVLDRLVAATRAEAAALRPTVG